MTLGDTNLCKQVNKRRMKEENIFWEKAVQLSYLFNNSHVRENNQTAAKKGRNL